MGKMSNVKLVKNDAFYNAEFDTDIFLYWMIKWLNVETTNNIGNCPILLILNRNQNGNRKYIYFRDFSYYEY